MNHIIKRHPGNVASTMVADYIKTESPVIIGEEDRIIFAKASPQPSSASTNTASTMTALAVVVFFRSLLL